MRKRIKNLLGISFVVILLVGLVNLPSFDKQVAGPGGIIVTPSSQNTPKDNI